MGVPVEVPEVTRVVEVASHRNARSGSDRSGPNAKPGTTHDSFGGHDSSGDYGVPVEGSELHQ
ncbi:MAG: hypothetical protein IPM39_27780 [Chloroflexi bacterium]|nr:hypothetical protein [Chloroflexota bacterium]